MLIVPCICVHIDIRQPLQLLVVDFGQREFDPSAGPQLVQELRDILGAKLVACLGSVKEIRAARQWADADAERALDDRSVVQTWFKGTNPQLYDGWAEIQPSVRLRWRVCGEVGCGGLVRQ